MVEFTWFGPAQTQLQILGFFAMILFGAIYEILPRVMGKRTAVPEIRRCNFWLFMLGVLLLVVPLVIGGVEQGMKLRDANIAFADANATALLISCASAPPAVAHPARRAAVCREHFCHDDQVETWRWSKR